MNVNNHSQPQAKWHIHNQGVCTTSTTMLVARLAVLREVGCRSNLRKEGTYAAFEVLMAARNKRRARPFEGGLWCPTQSFSACRIVASTRLLISLILRLLEMQIGYHILFQPHVSLQREATVVQTRLYRANGHFQYL